MLEAATKSIRHLVNNRKYWCLFFAFLAINFVVIHRNAVEPGVILASDFTRAEDFGKFVLSQRYPLWSEYGQTSNLPWIGQLGLFAPAIIISSIIDNIPSTVVYVAYYVVLGSLSGVFSFKLAEYVMVRLKLKPRFEFPLASSLFFMFATFVAETTFQPGIAYLIYLSPLFLYALIRGVEEGKLSYLLLCSFIYSLWAAASHYLAFGLIIILSYIVYDLLYRIVIQRFSGFSAFKRAAWYTLIVLGPFVALSSYWLIPNIAYSGLALYPNLLTAQDPEILHRNIDIINVFSLKGLFLLHEIYPESQLAYINILSIMLTVIAVSSLLLYKPTKLVIYLAILLVVSVIISVIPRYLPELYSWFIFDIPGSFLYSWVFRAPKFHWFMSIPIAVMISLSGLWIYQSLHNQKKRFSKAFPPIFIAIVLVLSLGSNYILLTGDFNGWHRSYDLPEDYSDVLAYLEKQDKNYKSIWGPAYLDLNSTWANNSRIIALEEQISPTSTFSSDTVGGKGTLNNYLYPLIFGMRFPYGSMVYEEQTNNLNEFLGPINVKYIVLHDDIPFLGNRIDKLSTALDKQEGLESKDFGFITLYTTKDVAPQFSTKQNTMLVQGGGLLKLDSLFSTKSITSNNTGVLFSDISLDQNREMWDSSHTLIPVNELSYAEYMLDKNDVIVIIPSAYTNDFAPERVWSNSPANTPQFLNGLKRSGIELPYQFDYGKNIVFTSANTNTTQLAIPLSVSGPGEYKVLLRYFANDKGGLLNLDLNGQPLTLETKSHLNRFVWTDLGTLRLSQGTQKLSIENRNGLNALNLVALIPAEKYEQYKAEFTNSLVDKDIIHIFEAESDFNSNARTSSVVHDIDYSNGRAIELRTGEVLSTRFEILKDGNYHLAIYGEGTITVYIDGVTSHTINLVDGVAHNETVSFDSGNHYIEITSTDSMNSSYLDSLSIASIRTDDNQSSLVQEQHPGEEAIIRYNKIDPTSYEVSVEAESPFMLAFAEGYDERWTAEVEETSTGIKKIYKPLPLYGAINGFMIDAEEGEYVVHIKYAPQEIFSVSAGISAASYAFVIVYLIRGHLIFARGRNN
jgi:hypothetical protein